MIRAALRNPYLVVVMVLNVIVIGLISLLRSLFNLRGGEGSTTYTSVVRDAPSSPAATASPTPLDDDE